MNTTVSGVASEVGFYRVFGHMFHEEWSGSKRAVPYCEALKLRSQRLNIKDGFTIPNPRMHDENLLLANMGIIMFIESLNDHIDTLNNDFDILQELIKKQQEDPTIDISTYLYKVRMNSEILAYYLKTILDKVIVLLCKLEGRDDIDGIGALLAKNNLSQFCAGRFTKYKDFLEKINGLHNSYKHTFSNLQLISIVPQIEPVMATIYKNKNSTEKPSKIYHMICSNALDQFNSFIKDSKQYTEGIR